MDVVIAVKGDGGARGSAERIAATLPLPALRAQLELLDGGAGWPTASIPGMGEVVTLPRASASITVEAERDVAAAVLLHRCNYASIDALRGASEAQLLAVLRLAEKYKLRVSMEAAAAKLSAIPLVSEFEWATVEGIFALPRACQEVYGGSLLEAAEGELLRRFGDLDEWMDSNDVFEVKSLSDGRIVKLSETPRETLRGMSFTALCTLLADGDTRASCEETALAMATEWYCSQEPEDAARHASELAACIRLARLSPVTLGAVVPRLEWLAAAVSPQQLLELAVFAGSSSLAEPAGLAATHPQWFLPARPASWIGASNADVKLSVPKVERAVKQTPEGSKPVLLPSLCDQAPFFRGFFLEPALEVAPCPGGGVKFNLRICADGPADSEAVLDVPVKMVVTCSDWRREWVGVLSATTVLEDFWGLGVPQGVGGAAGAWVAKGLLDGKGDGWMSIRIEAA